MSEVFITLVKTKSIFTVEDYLRIDRTEDERYEFIDGEIYAMAGAKRRHNVIAWNIGGELRQHLKGKNCEAYPANMRVFVPQTGLYTYPDLVVICGEPQFQDDTFDTLLNPILIIEVLSDTTENYDRGKKFQHYRSIESLQEYVLVSHDEARIEKYIKQGDGFWVLSEAVGLDAKIKLDAIDCELALNEVFDKVNFSDE